jgi:phage shock protein B
MDALEALIPLSAILSIFVGLPWLLFHYITKWKQAKSITIEDEDLLDELHDLARRLDDRMTTIERIVAPEMAPGIATGRPAIPGTPEPATRISNLRTLGKDS